MGNKLSQIISNFGNISSSGKDQSISFVPENYLDEKRLKFYATLLDTPLEQLKNILKIANQTVSKVDPDGMNKISIFLEENKTNRDALQNFVAIVNEELSNMPGDKVRLTLNDEVINKAIEEAALRLQTPPPTPDVGSGVAPPAALAAAPAAAPAGAPLTAPNISTLPNLEGVIGKAPIQQQKGLPFIYNPMYGMHGGGIIKELLDKDPLTDKDIQDNIDKLVREYPYDYQYGPEAENVNMTDRVIFVATTYIVRAISLFMVEWGIHTGFINNFIKAFSLYFGVYVSVLILLYILTNANLENYLFRALFYYINGQTENGKGNMRIGIHVLCLLFLFPVPFVVREYRQINNKNLTFTEKRSILNGVEKFTLIAWVLTSIVALRV